MHVLSDSGAFNQKGGAGSSDQSEASEGGTMGKGTPRLFVSGVRACAERWAGCAGGDAPGPARPERRLRQRGALGAERGFGGIKTTPGEGCCVPPS